jgi:hypothetical protein
MGAVVGGHSNALRGKTEKQLTLAVQALRRRRSVVEGRTIRDAAQIAAFLGPRKRRPCCVHSNSVTQPGVAKEQLQSVAPVGGGQSTRWRPRWESADDPTWEPESPTAPRTESLEVFGDF